MGGRIAASSRCALLALGSVAVPTAAHAIQADDPALRSLVGAVVEEVTRRPIPGAVVLIEGVPGTVTDSLGRFSIEGIAPGPHELRVRQFGYLSVTAHVDPPALPDVLVEIPLAPSPIAIDGLSAVVDRLALMNQRLESRRRATPTSVRTFDQERLVRSGTATFVDFLLAQPAVLPTSCAIGGLTGLCFVRRGRVIRPRVFIDELPAFGGLDELATYAPRDLYLVEIYSSGLEIRAYTHHFTERMARRPMALLPAMVGR